MTTTSSVTSGLGHGAKGMDEVEIVDYDPE
jgi:hypothetical protein